MIFVFTAFSFVFARENENDRENSSQGTMGWGEMKKLNNNDKEDDDKDNKKAAIIEEDGDFKVNGVTVNSVNVSANTINVTFFGFTRDINVSGAKFFSGGKSISLSDIQSGDKLNANGNYNVSTKVVTVEEVQDTTLRTQNISEIQKRIQQLMDMINALKAKLGIQ